MKEWIQLQRDLYKSTWNEIRRSIHFKSKTLARYEAVFRRDQVAFNRTMRERLVKAMNEASFVFVGDFHTLHQSQRLLLRFLRDRDIKKPQNLGLEVLHDEHLKYLHAFLKDPSETKSQILRDQLRLEERFGASFETFKELFLACHKAGVKLIPLHSKAKEPSDRDRDAAKRLLRLTGRIWVLMGEYHCARPHLPHQLQILLKKKLPFVILQQNDDHLSLKSLKDLSRKKTLIFEAKATKRYPQMRLFCVLHTPPWIKWQSFLQRHILNENPESELDSQSAHDQLTWSLRTLLKFFDDPRYVWPVSESELMDFSVHSPNDPSFESSTRSLRPRERKFVLRGLREKRIVYIARRRRLYIGELNINTCAQAAGMLLYQNWAHIHDEGRGLFSDILVESIGFLLSKLLNHSRRALRRRDWEHLLHTPARSVEARAVLHSLRFSSALKRESTWLKTLRPFSNEALLALSRMLADAAFEAFLVGELSRARLIRILTTPLESEEQAFETLMEFKSLGRSFFLTESRRW